jgi:hypothetical protein
MDPLLIDLTRCLSLKQRGDIELTIDITPLFSGIGLEGEDR